MDNIKTWTGLPAEESIRMTEDREKWRKYVYGVANRRIEDGYRTEHNNSRCSRCLLQPLCPSVTLLLKNIQSVTPRVYALKYRSQWRRQRGEGGSFPLWVYGKIGRQLIC